MERETLFLKSKIQYNNAYIYIIFVKLNTQSNLYQYWGTY